MRNNFYPVCEGANKFVQIRHVRESYSRTDSGKSWRKKPDYTEEDIYTIAEYNMFNFNSRFFHSRTTYGYTYVGYVPVRVVTVFDLTESKKYIDKFTFEAI